MNQIFDDRFIESLPDDIFEAIKLVEAQFEEFQSRFPQKEQRLAMHESYVAMLGFLRVLAESHGISMGKIVLTRNPQTNIDNICSYMRDLVNRSRERKNELILSAAEQRAELLLTKGFVYEFSDGDLARVQKLINELRDLITKSKDFEDEHKSRLLKKLEQLQSELHKRMSNLDKLWGIIGEAGIILGKFGEDAKPFTDRIREILTITWRIQVRAEELESGFEMPLLKKPDEATGKDEKS